MDEKINCEKIRKLVLWGQCGRHFDSIERKIYFEQACNLSVGIRFGILSASEYFKYSKTEYGQMALN